VLDAPGISVARVCEGHRANCWVAYGDGMNSIPALQSSIGAPKVHRARFGTRPEQARCESAQFALAQGTHDILDVGLRNMVWISHTKQDINRLLLIPIT
jgi:hypothetical protein